jgi:hypothetical protein
LSTIQPEQEKYTAYGALVMVGTAMDADKISFVEMQHLPA